MGKAVKIGVIWAGSAQFSLGLVKNKKNCGLIG